MAQIIRSWTAVIKTEAILHMCSHLAALFGAQRKYMQFVNIREFDKMQ